MEPEQPGGLWDLAKCRRAYTTYLDSKRLEIEEQQMARRYRHGVQWTSDQVKTLNDRKQPVVTYNRIGARSTASSGWWRGLSRIPRPSQNAAASAGRRSEPPCCAISWTRTVGMKSRHRLPRPQPSTAWPALNWIGGCAAAAGSAAFANAAQLPSNRSAGARLSRQFGSQWRAADGAAAA